MPAKAAPCRRLLFEADSRQPGREGGGHPVRLDPQLIQSLLKSYESAKRTGYDEVLMLKDPFSDNPNNWILTWRKSDISGTKSKMPAYID